MQLFSSDATILKMKKAPLKVAHNWPRTFFFSTGPAAQTAQKQKSHTTKSPLMQDWVFRLGLRQRKVVDFVAFSECTNFKLRNANYIKNGVHII